MSSDLLCQVQSNLGSVAAYDLLEIRYLKNPLSIIALVSKKFGSRKVDMNKWCAICKTDTEHTEVLVSFHPHKREWSCDLCYERERA